MTAPRLQWPSTTAQSALAALATWVALWSWAGFVQSPSRYLIPTLGLVLLVAASGALLRAARLPSALVAVVQLALLALWMTHRWAAEAALGGWLPTPASIDQVGHALRQGVVAAQSYGAPIANSVPQIIPLLVTSGGLVAVLVDFLACGLRRVPAAGLPLLALYTAPVSILTGGVPWWVFASGAVSYLSLLTSDEGRRLTSWGRRVTRGDRIADTGGGAVSTASLRTSARRIGLTATGLAVVAPLVIPTLGSSLLSGNGPGGHGDGAAVDISNPMVDLRRDLVEGRNESLLTASTANGDPSYLRISVLDSFDGTAWKPSERQIPPEQRAEGSLPLPPGLSSAVARTKADFRFHVLDSFDSTWLPTPYPVSSINVPGDWRYDKNTLDFVSAVDGQGSAGLSYSLSAWQLHPTAQELLNAPPPPENVFTQYTALPENLPGRVSALARQVTAGAGNRFEKAVRLQRWFREDGGFRYSLQRAPGTGTDDLLAFLSAGPGGRVGYCEQFAAAMAVMGRTLGIPSRVAVGFLHPQQVGGNEYVYRSHDLHAWPEMYFEGVGWVRFEPTPGTRASAVPGYTTGQVNTPEPTALPSASVPASRGQQNTHNLRRVDPGVSGAAITKSNRSPWTEVLVALVVAALLLTPRLTRAAVRRRRWAAANTAPDVAEAGWRELRDVALDLRRPWSDSVTLRTAAHALASAFGRPGADAHEEHERGARRGARANPEAAQALERLVRDVELARYARASAGRAGRGESEVAADVVMCSAALRAGAGKRNRRLATWLPASLVRNAEWRSLLRSRPAGTRQGALVGPGLDRAS